jgi:hypothetical protein
MVPEPALLLKNRKSSLLYIRPGTNARLLLGIYGAGIQGELQLIGKQYFVRQATILFWIAKATKDPKMSAALMDKALMLDRKLTDWARRPI